MNAAELSSCNEFQLLDVRLDEDFEAAHLVGAVNNCVFEVAFADRLAESAPNRSVLTVVYGEDATSHEAEAAREKLERAGYRDVRILEGGIEAAEAAGLEITRGRPASAEPAVPQGAVPLDLKESLVEWTGRNLLNKHFGTVAIDSGHLEFADARLVAGEFVIDLRQLTCTDLAGTELHDVLIHHLHNEDFFDVVNHPTARFVITGTDTVADSTPGAPNLRIEGNLTLRGVTEPIEFLASAGITLEGKAAAQTTFSIDRTRWGVLYGSGKFFRRLAGHLVNDHIDFQLRILAG